jgi:Ca2+-binding EF-hand superfamily protein
MKRPWNLLLGICLLAVLAPSSAPAAKSDGPKAKFFAKYDKNHNGIIDEDEKEAIRKDYAANPEGELKRFDTNHDGKLDDEEIAAITPPGRKKDLLAFFAKYDLNHNGVIDENEKEAIRKDYAASPDGPLKQFDRNKDGKLDDKELAAIKMPAPKKTSGAGEKAAKPEASGKPDKPTGTEAKK